MRNWLYITLLAVTTLVASCSKDDETGSITLNGGGGLFVTEYGESVTRNLSTSNISKIDILSYPSGWKITVSLDSHTITAVAPATNDAGDAAGEIALSGTSTGGKAVRVSLEAGVVTYHALNNESDPSLDMQANSMIVSKVSHIYSFNPNRRGERMTEESEKATSCKLLWATEGKPIDFVHMLDDGSVAFYTMPDRKDVDEDGRTSDLVNGNALIGAYSASGALLWSWHIWLTDSELGELQVDDVTFMDRNIGAKMNKNMFESEILASYGMYYQWGRKDPFIYPKFYNAASAYLATTYDGNGELVEFKYSDSPLSKISYSVENPMTFIKSSDWLKTADNTLWGTNGEKSIYDPSPKGWRVPTAAEIAKLTLDADQKLDNKDFALTLNGGLFMALGRWAYLDGTIQNLSDDGSFKPWSGYYWSSDVAGTDATSLLIYLDSENGTGAINNNYPIKRGNALQIRAVKY